MGKIQVIQKSRKENRCGKCRTMIPMGSRYYKGILNFHPPIIRCAKCGLKHYEVTTSEYIREVGAVVEDWQEDFSVADGVWEEIADTLETIKDECEDRLYNMPEQLQESDAGQTLQERIDSLDCAIDDLRDCCMEDMLQEGYNNLCRTVQQSIDDAGDCSDYESWYAAFWEGKTEAAQKWKEATEEMIVEFINDKLSEISY